MSDDYRAAPFAGSSSGPPSAPRDAGVSAPLLSNYSHADPDAKAISDDTVAPALALPEDDRYSARGFLGSGGMGRVVSVHDRRLGRDIALKAPNPEAPLSAGLDERLAREARITGRLDHPGIVPIFDAGRGPDGRVYYTMPIVRGRSLAETLAHCADTEDRLRLLRRVLEACEAVGFAHRQGIVHCDLKPANVMLGAGGGTRVLDWGLARAVEEGGDDGAGTPSASVSGRGVGTPQYMSPEQAQGAAANARSDVWSLGAVLFEVCAGRPLRAPGSASEVLARARSEAPRGPLTVSLDSQLAPELVAIVTRALQPDPAARYPDAQALADDLARFLDGRRVTAHAYSRRELLARVLRAWRVPLLVAVVALAVVIALVALGVVRLSEEARRAEAAERLTQAALDEASAELARALVAQSLMESDRGARPEAEILAANALSHGESPVARGVLATWGAEPSPQLVARVQLPPCIDITTDGRELLCREDRSLSAWHLAGGRPYLRWRVPIAATHMVFVGDRIAAQRTFRTIAWLDAATGELVADQVTPTADRLSVVGNRLITSDNGTFWTWDGPFERGVPHYPCEHQDMLASFAYAPDAQEWSGFCGDGTLVLGDDLGTPPTRLSTEIAGPRMALALAYAGPGLLVAGTQAGEVVLVERATGTVLSSVATGFTKVLSMTVAPGGRWVAVVSATGGVVLVEPRAGFVRGRLPFLDSRAVAFARTSDPAGAPELLLAGAELRRYRVPDGPFAALDLGAGLTSVAFDPGDSLLAMTTGGGIEVRRLADGGRVTSVPVADGFIKGGHFAVDGRTYHINMSRNVELRVWDASSWERVPGRELPLHCRRMAMLADGSFLASQFAGSVHFFAPERAGPLELAPRYDRMADLVAAPGGHFAAVLHEATRTVSRFALDSFTLEPLFDDSSVQAVDISRDGSWVATAGNGGAALWDADTRSLARYFDVGTTKLVEVALASDLRWLAAGGQDGSVWIWDLVEGRLAARINVHTERVPALAFSGDSNLLASGSWDGYVRLFDLRRLETPAAGLAASFEAAWGTTLSDVFAR